MNAHRNRALAIVFGLLACGCGEDASGTPCETTLDCDFVAGETCTGGRCRAPGCFSDDDCEGYGGCVEGRCIRLCVDDAECPPGSSCVGVGESGYCSYDGSPCRSSADCDYGSCSLTMGYCGWGLRPDPSGFRLLLGSQPAAGGSCAELYSCFCSPPREFMCEAIERGFYTETGCAAILADVRAETGEC